MHTPPAPSRTPSRPLTGLLVVLLGLLGVALALTGCEREARDPDQLSVVVSIPPLKSLVEPLLPPGSEIRVLLPPGVSEHALDLRPSDAAALAEADLVVLVGLGLEYRVERQLERQSSRRARHSPRIIRLAETAGLAKPGDHHHAHHNCADPHHHHHHDHKHEDADGLDTDPHLWLDPVLVRTLPPAVADAVRATLQGRDRWDEDRASTLDQALASLLEEIEGVHRAYETRIEPFRGEAIVTHHAAFGRLASRYGLRIAEVLRPYESAEPTPGHIARTASKIKAENIRAVFVEPLYRGGEARRVAESAQIRLGRLDPLGTGDWAAMMLGNLDELERALAD